MPGNVIRHDPVGRHTIALRACHRELIDYQRKLKAKMPIGPIPTIPEYPKDYPTPDFLKKLRERRSSAIPRLVFESHISKDKLEEERTSAIKSILLQIGYDAENEKEDNEALRTLSQVTDTFLQSFIGRLRYHKDSVIFRNSQDLWDPLQTTLKEFRFKGAHGIAEYYYDELIRMNSALYNECNNQLKKIKAMLPVQVQSPDSQMNQDTMSPIQDEASLSPLSQYTMSPVQVQSPDNQMNQDAMSPIQDESSLSPLSQYTMSPVQDHSPDCPVNEDAVPVIQDHSPDCPVDEDAVPVIQDKSPDCTVKEDSISAIQSKSPDCPIKEDAVPSIQDKSLDSLDNEERCISG